MEKVVYIIFNQNKSGYVPLYVDESDAKFDDSQDPEQVCLIKQSFIKDPSKNIETLVNESVGKLGENIRIRRFSRFALGE